MTIGSHIKAFAGLPVLEFTPDVEVPADPGSVAWRVATDYEEGSEHFNGLLDQLVNAPWAGQIRALVIGEWGEAYDTSAPVGRLVDAAATLTSLTALFLGELTYEEQEISWIQQDDVTPLLRAYPGLEVLTVRGSEGLELEPLRHDALRELTFQSGGLPAEVVRAVGECELPELVKLELWLGTDNYGGDSTPEDLAQILAGTRLPKLRELGLRNSEIADQVAEVLAGAPIVARLSVLDMSMGMLADRGAGALLAGQPLTHLSRLDLNHHFISPAVQERLRDELEAAGVTVDLGNAGDPDNEDRFFISVSE